jgi:hypothetical protein
VAASFAAVDAAEAELERARADAPARLVARALGEEPAGGKTVPEAQAELDAARANLAAARAARDTLRGEVERVGGFDIAGARLKSAAAGALREAPALGALLGELERLQRELVERGSELVFLIRENVVDAQKVVRPDTAPLDARARNIWFRMQSPPASWHGLAREVQPGEQRWREALEALTRDADAPLPS